MLTSSVTMLRQSSSRNHRGKKLGPKHTIQVFLLVAASIWLMYQLTHSYIKRRALAVEITDSDGTDGELIRQRRLGRKGLIGDFEGDVSRDGVARIRGGGSNAGSESEVERETTPDRFSKGREGEGGDSDEEDEEPDQDDDIDNGLPGGDDDDDDKDLHPENDGEEDELKTMHSKTDRVRQMNTTDGVQECGALQLVNGAADGTGMTPELNSSLVSSSVCKNSSSDVLFNGREATGNVDKNIVFKDNALGVPGVEKLTTRACDDENRMATADSGKTGSDKAEDMAYQDRTNISEY